MYAATDRTQVRRHKERGRYDAETVDAILDGAFVCHVGVVTEHGPVVLPTAYARIGDSIYLHGAVGNAMLRSALDGDAPVCITVTLIDGLVFARSAFRHSMNYRSAVVFGRATKVANDAEKLAALNAIVDHMAPGRSAGTRPPSASELRETLVLRVPIEEVSAKVRTGGPIDDDEDMAQPYWAGVLPLSLTPAAAITDPDSVVADVPSYVTAWRR